MYTAAPQYFGSTSGLLPPGADSSIPMQPYPQQQQQQQGPYTYSGNNYNNNNNSFVTSQHDSAQNSFVSPHQYRDNPDDDPPPYTHYPRIGLKSIFSRLLPTLACNVILAALFAYVLKFYGDKKILLHNDRRLFNVASLVLAAALSTGIGYLLGEVGVLFRGSMMGKGFNTKGEIAHILRGSLGGYLLFFISHIRRKVFTHATTLSLLFVVGNILGRLSVALIGFTYAVDDESIETIPALEGIWWPEAGQPMRNQSIFVEPLLSEDSLMDLLLETSRVYAPFTEPVKIDMDDKGVGIVKDMSFLEVPGMELSVEKPNEDAGSVKYVYVMPDTGGSPAMRVERTMEIMAECARVTNKDLKTTAMSSSTFYPTMSDVDALGKELITGWTFFSHPRSGEDNCGPSCVKFGLTEGSSQISFNPRWEGNQPGYSCKISVTYDSPSAWGKRPGVSPSEDLLLLISSLYIGNGTHHDIGKSTSLFSSQDLAKANTRWIAPWGEISLRTRLYPQGSAMAGVLARGLALIVNKLGNGLDMRVIEKSTIEAVGVLSVDWNRVIMVFGAICVVQIVVAFIAGFLVHGSLAVEDDLDLLDGLIAKHRFPGKSQEAQMPEKPWVRESMTRTGPGELSFRFRGGAWGRLGEGVNVQGGLKG